VFLVLLAPEKIGGRCGRDLRLFDRDRFLLDLESPLLDLRRALGLELVELAHRLIQRESLLPQGPGQPGPIELPPTLSRPHEPPTGLEPADRGLPRGDPRNDDVFRVDRLELSGQEEPILEPPAPDRKLLPQIRRAARTHRIRATRRAGRGY